ncbi:MAG: CBS domain-containing protein [Bacteroidota bacterium]
MLAYELITDEVPSLKPSDTCKKVLNWMEDLRISHLPIISKRKFLGMISYNDILDLNNPDKTLDTISIPLVKASVKEHNHIYDVLKMISLFDVSAVAVLDEEDNYIGVITADFVIRQVAGMPFVHEPGGIIVLELNVRDYSLSQIAQIVEGNDARILNMYINLHPDSTKIEVTLKINKEDLSPIIQTFNRYDYTVKATFHLNQFGEDTRKRFDEFMHFLNI